MVVSIIYLVNKYARITNFYDNTKYARNFQNAGNIPQVELTTLMNPYTD